MLVESPKSVDLPTSERMARRSTGRSPGLAMRLHEEATGTEKFLVLVAQLFLLAIVIYRYSLETPAFVQLIELTFAGFVVHHFLPMAYRLRFFMALSLAAIVMVLGPTASAWLLAIGFGLIALCHLPAPIWARISLLAGAGVLLALMRGGIVASVVPIAIWPILGSMFAFRLVVYLYDLHFQ